jgi:hypothetical protein
VALEHIISTLAPRLGDGQLVILLDACRSFEEEGQGGSLRVDRVATPAAVGRLNVLVGFAAGSGQVAFQSRGRNSRYTAALLHWINKEGHRMPVTTLMHQICRDVSSGALAQGDVQVPWTMGSIHESMYIVSAVGGLPLHATRSSPTVAAVLGPLHQQFMKQVRGASLAASGAHHVCM